MKGEVLGYDCALGGGATETKSVGAEIGVGGRGPDSGEGVDVPNTQDELPTEVIQVMLREGKGLGHLNSLQNL